MGTLAALVNYDRHPSEFVGKVVQAPSFNADNKGPGQLGGWDMGSSMMGWEKAAFTTPLQRATIWALAGQVLVMIFGFILLCAGAAHYTAGLLILCLAANAVLAVVNIVNIWPRKAKS